jgi:putative peptide zinc metalloprotease protein
MSEALFSASWYRVEGLTPRLRSHAQIHRHRYRGETWFVLQDSANDRFLRFTPAAHFVIDMMDGVRTVDAIWHAAASELGDDAPTQDEMIQLLGGLHTSDVLRCDVPPDAAELFQRGQKQERQQRTMKLLSPFSIRFRLLDPERFLRRALPLVKPLIGGWGALLWLAVVVPAAVLIPIHWTDLTQNFLDHLLAPQSLLAIWLIFPILKGLHEFGHGFAAKAFGGEVHEMGVMFLVFTPVPYVDASCSWAFRSKYQRALVGAGGMIVELFIAALAFYVWLAVEPGTVRALAYNVLIVGGLTTLLFNANPLLRFDGYYILSDLIEIPNLAKRSNQFVGFLAERYAIGNKKAEPPYTAPGEPAQLVAYSLSAFVYRLFIVAAILGWILSKSFVAGLLLGTLAIVTWFGIPIYKMLNHLLTSPRLRNRRARSLAICGGVVAFVLVCLALIPVPLRTRAEGVVWMPEEAVVRARTAGFVARVVAQPDTRVAPGDLLIETRDPVLEAEADTLAGRVHELEAHVAQDRADDRAQVQITLDQLRYARQSLADADRRRAELDVRSQVSGRFVLPRAEDLPGRFVSQGQLLAYVLDVRDVTVRAVVPQDDVDLVRQRTTGVEVRLADRIAETYPAKVRRIVPAASADLPSSALGRSGGGGVPVDPSDPSGGRSVESMFEAVLELPAGVPVVNAGGRVYIRFDHGLEPLGMQWYRRLRQLFLSRFHV